jgi:hypothetical protein
VAGGEGKPGKNDGPMEIANSMEIANRLEMVNS